MERTTFLEHYCTSLSSEGAPRELNRTGAAITYKAIDERSGDAVALTLIPIASIDPATREQFEAQARAAQKVRHINIAKVFDFGHEEDHFVYVSELLQGEPLASWVEEHGPMPADAVLRVAEQIVSVLSTASFHKLTHCAIQPSNLMIVPGSTPEGGWPFVKLMNFGLAGLKLDKPNGGHGHEESFSAAPKFASPEQVQHETVDFRSEVYSLGATMYFMLTGAVPPTDLRRQQLRVFPKALRNLLGNMLRHDPNQRPKDPVALTEMIRECLARIERRQALARRLGVPLAGVIPRKSGAPSTPLAQVFRGILVFAALVLAAGVLGAFLLPADINPFRHRTAAKQLIGVPIGVPEASPSAPPQAINTAPVVASQPATNAAASAVADQSPSPGPEQGQTSNPATNAAAPAVADQSPSPGLEHGQTSNPDFVAAATPPSVAYPTAGPSVQNPDQAQTNSMTQANAAPQPSAASDSTSPTKKGKAAGSISKRTRTGQAFVGQRDSESARGRGRWTRARMIGITSDGRLIFRLPSGRTAIVAPDSDEDQFLPRRHRRPSIDRDDIFSPRTVAPDYPPYD
jgi:serine/threonine protein kinase